MTEEELRDYFKNNVVSEGFLKSELTRRKKDFIYESIPNGALEEWVGNGWELEKENKSNLRMRRPKPIDVLFEDKVWTTFASLGFKMLNKDRNFKLSYGSARLIKQIDVFAADEETVLIVECKATEEKRKKENFKKAIESLGGTKEGLTKTIQKIFYPLKPKIKFIFATKNYLLSDLDIDRLRNWEIVHLDENSLNYYSELGKHLGKASRYQLLGQLFAGQDIPEINNKIPAIEGKMGGKRYYSFSIEPQSLLKLGYVLHRNQANENLIPTYQRLIKKTRLNQVQQFVEEGGYFPNSIIVSVDSKRGLRFYPAEQKASDSKSRIGILHLPKKYQSIYIIDGQHRLYGYSDTEYSESNTIPVIAFENLERSEQVRLFMEINENQKKVSKTLRLTLNSDLLWDDPLIENRIKAIRSRIAQQLGEEPHSPLFGKIIVGENSKTKERIVSMDAIEKGLKSSNFFGSFKNNLIVENGTFYNGDAQSTFKKVSDFLLESFTYVKSYLPEQWEQGDRNYGILTINRSITALIRIFSDITDLLILQGKINPKSDSAKEVIREMNYYLDPLIAYLEELDESSRKDLRKYYGSPGDARFLRSYQQAIHSKRNEFKPEGLEQYWRDEDKRFNEESFKIIRDIEGLLKKDFKEKLREHHGESLWFKKGVPKQVYDRASLLALDKNREILDEDEEVEPWDCLTIIMYRSIATYGANWRDIFEKHYTPPAPPFILKGKSKDDKTKWMVDLEKIRNENFHSYSVKEQEYEFLKNLHEWLIE